MWKNIKGFFSSRNGRPLSAPQRKGCMSEDQVNRQTYDFSYLMDIGTVKNIKIVFLLLIVIVKKWWAHFIQDTLYSLALFSSRTPLEPFRTFLVLF